MFGIGVEVVGDLYCSRILRIVCISNSDGADE
jgi:hypothetical protein